MFNFRVSKFRNFEILGDLLGSPGHLPEVFGAQLRKANLPMKWCEALSSFSPSLVALRAGIPGTTTIRV